MTPPPVAKAAAEPGEAVGRQPNRHVLDGRPLGAVEVQRQRARVARLDLEIDAAHHLVLSAMGRVESLSADLHRHVLNHTYNRIYL
jgi:hypothetical protein